MKKCGQNRIEIYWESTDVQLLGITLDNNLKFDNMSLIFAQKLTENLTRIAKFLPFKKGLIPFKAFIESQFKYCPFVWMFHRRQINNKIHKVHERALRIVYNDTSTSFEKLIVKDKISTIHHQNIQSFAIEMYKAVNNLPGRNLSEIFVKNNHNYNLHSRSERTVPSINTVFKDRNSVSYFGSVIWNSIPVELKRINSFQVFRPKVKAWRPTNGPCRLFKNYIENLDFINIAS